MAERSRRWKDAHAEQWRDQKRAQGERRRRKNGSRSQAEISAEAEQRRLAQKTAADARKSERLAKPWNRAGLSKAESIRIRYRLDPEFNANERVRAGLRRTRQGVRYGDYIRGAIRRDGESRTVHRALGYTIAELCRHLERQFTKGMSWGLFLSGKIHIDHIVPLASFDLRNAAEAKSAWALSNLRPMWGADNRAKYSKRQHLL